MRSHVDDILSAVPQNFAAVFSDKLEALGVDDSSRSGFLRDLSNVLSVQRAPVDLKEVNDRLSLLGWPELELDYRALELIQACLEYHQAGDGVSH